MPEDKNPQNAKIGDLIMWTSNTSGFQFGKIISWMADGRPMVKPIGQPYVQTTRDTGEKYWSPNKYSQQSHPETGEKGFWYNKYEPCNILMPVHYDYGQQSGYSWMVIAYGDDRVETVTAEHPIAKARRQFMELEGKKGYAF